MTTAYLEPFAGIAGDMTVAALLDLGLPMEALEAGLSGLPLRGYHLVSEKVRRGDFVGRRFVVEVAEPHPHR
ncbi:MAG: nickel insertion protein, partial [Planctomycetota bacterium]